jgi:hypothetical protein
MHILPKTIILSLLVFPASLAYSQETINVFGLFKEKWLMAGFAKELESGDFKAVWGQSLDDVIIEIADLNALFYEETDDRERERKILEYVGETRIPPYSYVFRPEVKGESGMFHDSQSNIIGIYGGYVVLSYLIACCYSYDQYCQIYQIQNELYEIDFLSRLQKIVRQNWFCKKDSDEYRGLTAWARIYGNLEDGAEQLKSGGKRRYSLFDFFNTNFQFLLLYIYSHEISHLVLDRSSRSGEDGGMEGEIEADMSAARFLYTRVKEGWGVRDADTGEVAVEATIEPLIQLLEFVAKVYPGVLEERLVNFLRHYVWVESFYANGVKREDSIP